MAKLPWMKFNPADWSQDTTPLSLAGRGAWITIICAMWRTEERGKLSLPIVGFCRLLGASKSETLTVIDELVKMGVCDTVTEANKNITLICRRMVREYKYHKNNALRQERYRVTHCSNANITGEKSEVRSKKIEEEKNKKRDVFIIPASLNTPEFQTAWNNWQKHRTEIKKKLTPSCAAMQLKEFESWGIARSILAIEHTIKKGWQGIKEPEENNKTSKQIPSTSIFALKQRLEILQEQRGSALNFGRQEEAQKLLTEIKETKQWILEATK